MVSNYLRILSVDDPADAVKLARKAKRVKNVQSTETIVGIQRMKRAATAWEHETGRRCEGLAAPQIGWNVRVIIVRDTNEMEPKNPRDFTEADWAAVSAKPEFENKFEDEVIFEMYQAYAKWARRFGGIFDPWRVMINPVIKQVEGERKDVEGCLSVPHGGYEVTRPTHVAFKYLLPNGKAAGDRSFYQLPNGRKVLLDEPNGAFLAKFIGDDHSAQVLMHEIEHLNGVCISQKGLPVIGAGSEKL